MRHTHTFTARWETSRSATRGECAGPSTDHAFLYSVSQSKILTDIVYPGSTTTTAYGIWYNGGTSYTICGGYYAALLEPARRRLRGYLVDYDSATGQFTQLDVIRRSERSGRPELGDPFPGDQQHRSGRLHARCRLELSQVRAPFWWLRS